MRPSVAARFPPFTDRFEGCVTWMYLDILGLVTTGRGNLIDPVGSALGLPWIRRSDGSPASKGSITDEWNTIKALKAWAPRGGGAFAQFCQLRLLPKDVDALTQAKLAQFAADLTRRFPAFEAWPAAAQLGALSMCWAMGSAFVYPHFAAAAHAQDWKTCADECWIRDEGNPGLHPRNLANVALFNFAASSPDLDALP